MTADIAVAVAAAMEEAQEDTALADSVAGHPLEVGPLEVEAHLEDGNYASPPQRFLSQ